MKSFMFATGIEGSDPTIAHGSIRRDQYAECGFYDNWRTDFALVGELGIKYLRYGPSLHNVWLGVGRYEWSFMDETMEALQSAGIVPIIDLCHFGLPDWLGNFQNPDFTELFPRFAADFAWRYPWVRNYTPINEMQVCANFSGMIGIWNEQLRSDFGFVTALKHMVKANIRAMQAILQVRPDAMFLQSEGAEHWHAEVPEAIPHAKKMNSLRYMSLDLNYGHALKPQACLFMMDSGAITYEELKWFMRPHVDPRHCILGIDYYASNEHRLNADGERTGDAGETFGWAEVARKYHKRYRLPIMLSETNFADDAAGKAAKTWLWRTWQNALRLRSEGVPLVGFCWYSLAHQVDWSCALARQDGHVDPLGLCDLDRNVMPVGREFQRIIRDWSPALPAARMAEKADA